MIADLKFSNAGTSPENGVMLMEALGINALDLQTPEVSAKFQFVAEYFNKFSDGPALARRVGRNVSGKDKLAKILEYTQLRKGLDIVRDELKELGEDDTITNEDQRNELRQREAQMIKEIQLYE